MKTNIITATNQPSLFNSLKKALPVFALTLAALLLTSCAKLDVVADYSVKSLDAVITTASVTEDAVRGGWTLTAPDQSASFTWSRDLAATDGDDLQIEVLAQPFLDAGLDPAKFTGGIIDGQTIAFSREISQIKPSSTAQGKAIDAYQLLIGANRKVLGYHEALDHYGLDLEGGNMFEWAKDLATNDKDIVFVLNPEPFITAGVNPDQVEGWIFAKVEVMDEQGAKVQVDKFLKPFDLR